MEQSYQHHRKSDDSDKTAQSSRSRQNFFKRPQLSDFNPFSSANDSTPSIVTDNEYLVDPLENSVSPTTPMFSSAGGGNGGGYGGQQPILDPMLNSNTPPMPSTPPQGFQEPPLAPPPQSPQPSQSQSQSQSRKPSRAPFHRLRTALSNAHLSSKKQESRRASPEMNNYDTSMAGNPSNLHPDYRRPSYASQTTQSSTGSRRSHTEASSTESPMHGSTSLPQSLDPSELSLITKMPQHNIDGMGYASNMNQSFRGPVSYPDPEQVFDTKSMYQEQARAMQDYDDSHGDSVASSISDKPKKHKKSFLNILRRRESAAELQDRKEKEREKDLYKLKHKQSESNLPLRQASGSSQYSKSPSYTKHQHHPLHYFPLHKPSFGHERDYYSNPRPAVRQRSKSSSYQPPPPPSKPLPPVPSLDVLPKDLLKDFRGSRMFNLDTDLNSMQGIVQQADQPSAAAAAAASASTNTTQSGRPTSSQSYDEKRHREQHYGQQLKPLTSIEQNGQAITTDATVGGSTTPREPSTGTSTPAPAMTQSKWTAPESWGVVENKDTTSSAFPTWGDGFDDDKTLQKKPNHCLRVFREDGTFGTLSCRIDISVNELLQMLGRKFFLNSITGYELSARTSGLTRILEPHEKPLLFQKMLLEFMGYTENDRLGDVGREDLSYLCRFEFGRSAMRKFTDEEEEIITRDFVNVELPKMNLQTIPIVFYQHTSELERLDVSRNPSITLPLDFIQACTNLKAVRFVDNQARHFPQNIDKTMRLESLDLSNNLILDLGHVDFGNFANLRSLDLQGNRLNEISPNIVLTRYLSYLNLSSNNLRRIPDELCTISTLVELDLSFNHISLLPPAIGQLTNLEKLLITNNDLTMSLPDSFKELASLRELDIRYNKLQNIDVLSMLPKLEVLYCSKNSVYSFEDSFPRLKLFYFDRNPITRIAFKEVHDSLAVLNLSKAKLASLPENVLEKIPMVEKLVLDKNHLVTLPPHIGNLKRLMSLSVVGNKLSNLPAEIGQLQNLEILDMHSNNLKSLPEEIWNMPSLVVLNASSNLLEAMPSPSMHMSSVSSSTGNASVYSRKPSSVVNPIDSNYEIRLTSLDNNNNKRRPSQFSNTSAMSPREVVSRRGSAYPPHSAAAAAVSGQPIDFTIDENTTLADDGALDNQRGLADSLSVLSLADNRLQDECFGPISHLSSLQMLNLSYNDLLEVPTGALGMLPHLTELYLSGNGLSGLPSDDFEYNQALRVFHVNGNKLHSLPAELGKMPHLAVLDVGSNNLRYNINNWPYDWNWNWNQSLKYLNFSGNQKLEVKRDPLRGMRDTGERNLSDFTVLEDIRVLGLMDVTLTIPSVPDQTENCRVRTYGSSVLQMKYGMADSLGFHNNLSIMDMVIERFRGNEKEAVLGLFDGRNASECNGNKVSKLIQETFGGCFSEELSKLRDGETTRDALRRAFLYTNKEIGNTTMLPQEEIAHSSIAHRSSTAANLNPQDRMSGSCATIVYVNDNKLYVANVGDSMAIMTKCTLGDYAVLTKRHDPTSQEELARIRGGAGVVSSTGKLDGILDVSRAIGFYNLIPHIHAAPSIFEYELTGSEDYLIVASKQLWEYVSFENAFDVARTQLHNPMLAAQKLRDFAIAYGCCDKIMVQVLAVGQRNSNKRSAIAQGRNGSTALGGGFNYGRIPGYEEELFPSVLKKRRDRQFLPEDSTLARLGGEVEPPVGDVAMVFTDIKNSTLLWETYPVAMRSAIKIHNTIMRRQILIMRGYEVKTEGDAFIVSFPTPTSALLWCFSVQQQLLMADWPAEILASEQGCEVLDDAGEVIFRGLSVRMGVHWGTPVFEPDVITKRMDYFGPMVNRTARISAVADGGQIALSTDFLAEMRLLDTAYLKVKDGGETLVEAYGDEMVGESINKDMTILDSLNWEVKEIGEMKLKGLENPELITVAYQKSLMARYPIHEAAFHEQQPNQNGTFIHHNTNNTHSRQKSNLMGNSKPNKNALISYETLVQMRSLSNRLEKICSQMNSGESSLGVARHKANAYDRKTARNVLQVVPNTDADYLLMFEHIVTRIENALSTLYLRAAMGTLNKTEEPYTHDLSQLLEALRDMI